MQFWFFLSHCGNLSIVGCQQTGSFQVRSLSGKRMQKGFQIACNNLPELRVTYIGIFGFLIIIYKNHCSTPQQTRKNLPQFYRFRKLQSYILIEDIVAANSFEIIPFEMKITLWFPIAFQFNTRSFICRAAPSFCSK